MKTCAVYFAVLVLNLVIAPRCFAQGKKTQVDLLIINTTVVDVVKKSFLAKKTVAILNGRILAIADSPTGFTAKRRIDGTHLIAIPGFINTHTHLWQHVCKSCFPKESLQVWVRIYNNIHYLTPEQLYMVVLSASGEALLSGITTVSDYASLSFNDYAFDVNARAIADAGLDGAIVYNNPSIFIPDSIKIKEIPLLQEKYKRHFSIWMGFGPLSFYPLPQVYSGIALGNQLGMNFTEHTMENNQEQRDFYDGTKKYLDAYKDNLSKQDADFLTGLLALKRPSNVDGFQQLVSLKTQLLRTDSILKAGPDTLYKPLSDGEKQTLDAIKSERLISPLLLLEYLKGLNNFLSIHSVWPQKEDIGIMQRNKITISHNPESNLYLTSGMAPVDDYLRANLTVSLGTDGAASNDGINMFSAMREMWNVYKIKLMNTHMSKRIEDWDILQSATINGAKALKIDNKTGSLDVGKEADIALVSADELGMAPIRPKNLVSLLIYSGNTRNIKYVISNGKIEVENGKLTGLNESRLALELTKIANDADRAVATGKIWSESIVLTPQNLRSYLYRYRSVRKLDSLHLVLINRLNHPVKIVVASSGAVFGGGTPAVISETTAARFPMNYGNMSFKDGYVLNPNESITVIKRPTRSPPESRIFPYQIISPKGRIERITSSGQLLVLAESRYKPF